MRWLRWLPLAALLAAALFGPETPARAQTKKTTSKKTTARKAPAKKTAAK